MDRKNDQSGIPACKTMKPSTLIIAALPREDWKEQVYLLLCKSQGWPADEPENEKLMAWARTITDDYFSEGYTPQEAHDESMEQ